MRLKYHPFVIIICVTILFMFVLTINASTNAASVSPAKMTTVRRHTATNPIDFKELTVECPKGMKAISGGAGIFYDSSEGVYVLPALISNFMYPDDKSWFAEAVQPRSAKTEWYLEVHVTCVDNG